MNNVINIWRKNPKFGWPFFRKKNCFPKQIFLRYFLASGDTIPEIDPGGSGGKRHFFNLEIAKLQKKEKMVKFSLF